MRMQLRRTRISWRYRLASCHSGPLTCKYFSSSGRRYFTKERLRQRFISNNKDWLSSSARPRSRPTGWSRHLSGSPKSYMAWPVSCTAPRRPEKGSFRSNRVVTRMSPGTPSVNGCSLSSRRPRSKGKPSALSTSTASERRRVRSFHLDGLIDEAGEPARQRFEYGIDVGRRHARRKAVDQCVIRRQSARLAEQRRLVSDQMNHL